MMSKRAQFGENPIRKSSNVLTTKNDNKGAAKFPTLKSKGRVLSNAINRDLSKTSIVDSKAAYERQRENASKLAAGRSVVDKANKENVGARNKQVKPGKVIDPRNIVVNKEIFKTKSSVSLYVRNEYGREEKNIRTATPKKGILKAIKVDSEVKVIKDEEKVEEKKLSKAKAKDEVKELTQKFAVPSVPSFDTEEGFPNSEFLLGVYADDIHSFLRHMEEVLPVRKDYLTAAHKMTPNMRSLLIDWLFEVQQSFNLQNDTIHIAIGMVDRYLQDHPGIPKNELQLVGVACIFLAAKYEEIYPPDLEDLVEISAKTYTKAQIKKMEQQIFSSLKFQLGRPSPAQFLKIYARVRNVDATTYCLAKYFVDLSLVNYYLCHIPPSLLAATSLYLAVFCLTDYVDWDIWTVTLIRTSRYVLDDIKIVLNKLVPVVLNVPTSKYQTVKNKYLDPKKTRGVSAIPNAHIEKLTDLTKSLKKYGKKGFVF